MRLCSIASGSSGNCIYIGTESTHVLVDAGISAKRMEEGLRSIGVEPDELQGILITHEHSDHVQGLRVFTKKHFLRVYATEHTLDQVPMEAVVREERMEQIEYDKEIQIGNLAVRPFEISHDAACPVSYSFVCDGHKIGMATDLGTYSETTVECLKDSEILYLEANHDVNMLLVGSYPYSLKQRVLGERGHLSNDLAAELIVKLLHRGMKYVILGHLSKENNYPELAYETVYQEVKKHWSFDTPMPEIFVANREKVSKVVEI
ncbi:MAG: MBL fold metallo-hydrolase [Lachnospiraceae bacterium]|nr:MBL fold metallo-hydrolase [Lachnospiraceae bacterium]